MIFVSVGTLHFPFDRLFAGLEDLPHDEELVVQSRAPGRLPPRARAVEELTYEEMVEHIDRARVVICHAGVGSVLTALGRGKRPVVVPRLARYGEAVDDHQLAFSRRLAAAGLITLVEDPHDLAAAVGAPQAAAACELRENGLARELRATLSDLLGYSR